MLRTCTYIVERENENTVGSYHKNDITSYIKTLQSLCLCRAVDSIKLSGILEREVGEFQAFSHVLYFFYECILFYILDYFKPVEVKRMYIP